MALHVTQAFDGRGVLRFRGWPVGVFRTPDRADQVRRQINLTALATQAESQNTRGEE